MGTEIKTKWTCTDPDNLQYGRKLADGIYEFKEFDRDTYHWPETGNKQEFAREMFNNEHMWIQQKIILLMYSEETLENCVSAYYGSIAELKETCGDDWEWIVAECVFEQESELY